MRSSRLVVALLVCPVSAAPPLFAPDTPRLPLDEIGLYEVGFRYRGKPEVRMPVGWSGPFDDRTGVACEPAGAQDGRAAFLLHCPWRNGVGSAFQEFHVRLPRSRRITLTGATAMRSDVAARSDGSVFRLFVNGKKVLDELRRDARWRPFTIDLTPHAGKAVLLRFENDPGPRDDASFDFSLWGSRTLTVEGLKTATAAHAAAPPLDLRRMWSRPGAGVVPPAGEDGKQFVRRAGAGAVFSYVAPGQRLTYIWQPPARPDDPLFGRFALKARRAGGADQTVPLAQTASLTWAAKVEPAGPATVTVTGDGAVLARRYRADGEAITLKAVIRMVRKSLVVDISTDKPGGAALDAGGWGPVMRRLPVTTPYYSGQVRYLPREGLFVNTFLDWTASNATAHDGLRARYDALTDGSRHPIRERAIYTAAWNVEETFPNVPNPPSPYRAEMGRRLVLDIWGGRYTDIAAGLERLSEHGIRNCYAIIHDWQRSGYDNALPAHVPAAADKGGEDGMRTLVNTAKRLGYRIALHENYVDYYPNYERYDESDIALNSDATKQLAWYNPGTRVQSFAVKPSAILKLAGEQSPEIRRRYEPNAEYLDVHSAVPPWFHVDQRAGEPGAGMFAAVWKTHRHLWAYERALFGGPVTGEGNNHWYWSGLLDGVEAQYGAGWPSNQGMSAPLAVDFDLLRIHPLQANHGMGYYERWWNRPSWRGLPPMAVLDQYRMQQMAYGHTAFLAATTWNVLPLAWLEHHLVTPVAARSAASAPVEIRYRLDGKWVDSSTAARRQAWDCVRVKYANGLVVTANSGVAPLTVGGTVLPRFGWRASGAGVTAYTARRGNAIVDYAETATSVFANARSARDWSFAGPRRIRPGVASFEQTGSRAFRVTYRWRVGEPLDGEYSCFVHFSRETPGDPSGENIRFQGDHALTTPALRWTAGADIADGPHTVRVPDGIEDGDYVWSIGLFPVGGGTRLALEGVDDGFSRIILGTLHIRDHGARVTWTPETRPGSDDSSIYRQHVNAASPVVDFGPLRTDGSVLIERDGAEWVLRTWPRERAFHLEMSAARFGSPASVRTPDGPVRTVRRGPFWSLTLNGSSEYRWKSE